MAAVGAKAKESAPGAAGVGVVAGVHVEQEQSRVVERVVLIVTVPPPASLAASLVEHARCERTVVVAARALKKSQEVFTRSGRASVVCLQMLPDASMARGIYEHAKLHHARYVFILSAAVCGAVQPSVHAAR